MCPPGYHHNDCMGTPKLGHKIYIYIYIPSACFGVWHQSHAVPHGDMHAQSVM